MTEMMTAMSECGSHGWLMLIGTALIYGVLGLAGAALIKYLFFTNRPRTAG